MNQLSQNNLCHQIWFNLIWIKINLVSLLQRRRQCNDLVTSLYLSVNRFTSCFCVNLVSLLQRQVNENWSLQWASRLVSLLQWHSSSMQWLTHSHHSISLVSLLQWHDQNQSLWWASQFLHSESTTINISMIWKINRKIDRKTDIRAF